MGGFARPMLAALLAAALPSPTLAQRDDPYAETAYRALSFIVRSCDHPSLRFSPPHVIHASTEAERMIGRMLHVPDEICPGAAAAARLHLAAWVGEPDHPEIDLDRLRLLHGATARGLGGPADPALAERAGRLLWLLDSRPPALGWSEAEREAWLADPKTLALLRANVASPRRTLRASELLGTLLLRRDGPGYDPAQAVALLERAAVSTDQRQRLTAILTDGVHVAPDHARAARLWAWDLRYGETAARSQPHLLRIGRLAAAAARTPAEQSAALRILWAAALDGTLAEAGAERDALLARIGPVAEAALAAGDTERIAAALRDDIPIFGIAAPEPPEPPHRTVRLRALVGPDGRAAIVQLLEGSGSPIHDRAVIGAWAGAGHEVDLAATAAGRFAWVELPPVVPRYAIEPGPRS